MTGNFWANRKKIWGGTLYSVPHSPVIWGGTSLSASMVAPPNPPMALADDWSGQSGGNAGHTFHTTHHAGWSSFPGDCCSSVECCSGVFSFCAIAAAATWRRHCFSHRPCDFVSLANALLQKTDKVHETITFLLVALPYIHRFKNYFFTHRLSNNPFLIWLLTTPSHLCSYTTLHFVVNGLFCWH